MYKVKKDDEVIVTAGKEKGKKGKIEKVLKKNNIITQVVIDGLNVYKKHVKPNQKMQSGGIVDISKPLDISNVQLICPSCQKATRVEIKTLKEGTKKRACKKCGEVIDK